MLPKVTEAYREYLQDGSEPAAGEVKPTQEQRIAEELFPAIARYVHGYGYIEIGDQEIFGFIARSIGYGGVDFEDDKPDTLAEAMAALEKGLRKWFKEQGIELQE